MAASEGRTYIDPEPGPEFPGSITRHGTLSGWRKHQHDGTEICEPCRQAKAAYDQRWLNIPENTVRNRLTAKAQARATAKLRQRHLAEYRALYATERDRIYAEHGIEARVVQPSKGADGRAGE